MNNIAAGVSAGLVLALVFWVYMLVRGRNLVTFFKELDENIDGISEQILFSMILGVFIVMALLFGFLSGLVYSWIGSQLYFTDLALSLSALFSVLALVSKQPLIPDKIIWNIAVGSILGVLVPILAV